MGSTDRHCLLDVDASGQSVYSNTIFCLVNVLLYIYRHINRWHIVKAYSHVTHSYMIEMMSSYDAKGSSCRISNKNLLPWPLTYITLFSYFTHFFSPFFFLTLHVVFVHTTHKQRLDENTKYAIQTRPKIQNRFAKYKIANCVLITSVSRFYCTKTCTINIKLIHLV